jgi:hypothetical protein
MLMQKLFYYIQAAAAKSHPAAANRHNNSWQLPQTAPGFWDFAPTLLVIYGRPRAPASTAGANANFIIPADISTLLSALELM